MVSRNPGSGTRTAFQKRVLGGVREEGTNSNDCRDRDPGAKAGPLRCERASTADLLDVVAGQPGAMGYSELGAATGRANVAVVTIGESPATSEAADQGAYPFWDTEYGYTYGEPPATSPAASFLRYLTNQVGADILRTHGNRPCGELQSPALCRPAVPPSGPASGSPAVTVPG
ncbi:substrate-binding domain-containing protein [Actinoplanes sp. NPDC049265]|uniref:substrate-binding domain-containing protein n=1 Tax=Actinoplanes sp. NPDC049265 TaxID=3363902 RepID=UPI003724B871